MATFSESFTMWLKTHKGDIPIGASKNSNAAIAYESNKNRFGFDITINNLPYFERALIVGAGDSSYDINKLNKAIYEYNPDVSIICKQSIKTISKYYSNLNVFVIDSEIDPHYQLNYYPSDMKYPVIWNVCILYLPNHLKPSRIYWARFDRNLEAESFPDQIHIPIIKAKTSAEAGAWCAIYKMNVSEIGFIGVECIDVKYNYLREYWHSLLSIYKGKLTDYSEKGIIRDIVNNRII